MLLLPQTLFTVCPPLQFNYRDTLSCQHSFSRLHCWWFVIRLFSFFLLFFFPLVFYKPWLCLVAVSSACPYVCRLTLLQTKWDRDSPEHSQCASLNYCTDRGELRERCYAHCLSLFAIWMRHVRFSLLLALLSRLMLLTRGVALSLNRSAQLTWRTPWRWMFTTFFFFLS